MSSVGDFHSTQPRVVMKLSVITLFARCETQRAKRTMTEKVNTARPCPLSIFKRATTGKKDS